jgi:hypothetical protein
VNVQLSVWAEFCVDVALRRVRFRDNLELNVGVGSMEPRSTVWILSASFGLAALNHAVQCGF